MPPMPIRRRTLLKTLGALTLWHAAAPLFRPFVRTVAAEPLAAFSFQTPNTIVLTDIADAVYDDYFNVLLARGYRNVYLQATNVGSEVTFSAIWYRNPEGYGWVAWRNMSEDEYQIYFNDYDAQGYKLISVSGYVRTGAVQFAAIWQYDPAADYVATHGATFDEYQTLFNDLTAQGYVPTVVDGYDRGGELRYAALFNRVPGTTWLGAAHALSEPDYQAMFNNRPDGAKPIQASGWTVGSGNITYSLGLAITSSYSDDWVARHRMSDANIIDENRYLLNRDYMPTVLDTHRVGSGKETLEFWFRNPRVWQTNGVVDATFDGLDDAIRTYMQTRGVRSVSVAVTFESRLVYAKGYSWDSFAPDRNITPLSRYRLASVTKPITAMTIMRLIQETDNLELTSKLTTLLNLSPADTRMNDITVRHLLQHVGGWDINALGYDPMFYDATIRASTGGTFPISINDIITYMTARNLSIAPGTAYKYSNYGYALLGKIIEQVTGLPYAAAVQQWIFNPLGIQNFTQGRSAMELRQANEVIYHFYDPDLYNFESVVNAVNPPGGLLLQYGGFNIENMAAHGAWVANAVEVVRFGTSLDATCPVTLYTDDTIDDTFEEPIVGWANSRYSNGWVVDNFDDGTRQSFHDGSLPGTTTFLFRRRDGVNFAVLANQRNDPDGNEHHNALLNTVNDALNGIPTFPASDLFSEFGIQNPPTDGGFSIYLPTIKK